MATQTIENFNTLDLETLASVEGGGKRTADVFLSSVGGAAEGVYYCAGVGALTPYTVVGCADIGAVVGSFFPQ